jgi:two-component system, NarL family, nitrate/nitrite response regulator NarL
MTPQRTLVLADDPLARAGLAALLQDEETLDMIGQISPDTTTLTAFSHDVALLDLGWELDSTLAALVDTPLVELDTPLVVLLPDDEYLPGVLAALNASERTAAYGVLLRSAAPSRLVAAMHAAVNGLVTLEPAFVQSLWRISPLASTEPPPSAPLTPREREVLDLVAEGLPNKIIAARLHISEYTVKFHVNAILNKLGAGSRTEAVVRATRLGLITL